MATRRILAIIIALAMVLGMVFCFSGCFGSVKEFEPVESEIDGLVAISRQGFFIEDYAYDQFILYDPETGVMYSMISWGKDITITVLYNADGTPKLYNPDK